MENRARWRVTLFSAAVVVALVVMMALPAWAQNAGSTIQGTVKDESGGAIPGVTVTIAAPELQVGKIVAVTEANGGYRVGDLPAGTYLITFELPGFKTVVQKDFRLAIGFVARVDAAMAVGGIEESVTVSGQSPVVDLTTTSTSTNITRATLDAVPAGQGLLNLYAMTPGLTTPQIDVGDSLVGKRTASENYGPAFNATIRIEGIDIADGTNTGVYLSSGSLDEVQIRTSGNDAEVSTPGTAMVAVIKSGSNQFHGSYTVDAERPELQSDNLSNTLRAQGLTNTNPIVHLYDTSGDLGGRIVKDKLWFYVSLSRQDRLAGVPGFASGPGPDGKYLTADDPPAYVRARMIFGATKVSYQPTPNNRFIAAWQPTDKWQPQGLPPEPSRFVPLESTLDYHNPSSMSKGEFQSTLNSRMIFDVAAGYSGYLGDYWPPRSKFAKPVVPSNPPRSDIETGLKTGSNPKTDIQYNNHYHWDQGLNWLPEKLLGGHHELKLGSSVNWHQAKSGPRALPAGNYILITDRVNGVSGTPSQIQIRNNPTLPDPRATTYAGYVKDSWRVTDSLTLNLGVRIEKQHAFLPKQSREATPDFPTVFPAATYAPADIMTWWDAVPRLGVAWNLANQTVVKGTFGRFGNGIGTGLANSYNPMAATTNTYRWHDLNGDLFYQPGEVDLNPNGVDFLSTTAVTTNSLNKDLKQPFTTETTASFEREVAKNLGFRTLYVFKRVTDQYTTTNVLRPRSAYDIPLTRRDPGPDGALNTADDGGKVTVWDYNAAYRGAAFVKNVLQNTPRNDHYNSIEVTMTKRGGGRWSTTASFWGVKYHQWLVLIPDNPNNDANSLDEAWRWAGNASGSYELPWGVQFGVFVQAKIGLQSQRTNVFRAADPDGGPALVQQSTVTVRMDPMGSQSGTAINVVNLRSSKSFRLTQGQRVEFDFDLFNLLNSSAQTALTFASGPTFGYASDVLPARIARVGLRYSF